MNCVGCTKEITEARMKAIPDVTLCVPCTLEAGDVAVIKRYDEKDANGDVQSTFFVKDKALERMILKQSRRIASEYDFAIAAGDDAHLAAEVITESENGYSITEGYDSTDVDNI